MLKHLAGGLYFSVLKVHASLIDGETVRHRTGTLKQPVAVHLCDLLLLYCQIDRTADWSFCRNHKEQLVIFFTGQHKGIPDGKALCLSGAGADQRI